MVCFYSFVLFYFVIFGAQQHPSSFPIIVWRREVWNLCYILPPVFHRRKKRKSHTVWIYTVLSEFAVLAIPITLGLEFVNLTSASSNSVASVFKYCTLLLLCVWMTFKNDWWLWLWFVWIMAGFILFCKSY